MRKRRRLWAARNSKGMKLGNDAARRGRGGLATYGSGGLVLPETREVIVFNRSSERRLAAAQRLPASSSYPA